MKKYITPITKSLYLTLVLFPFLWGLRTSIAARFDDNLIPVRLTLSHYQAIMMRPELLVYLRNSLVVSGCSIFFTLFIAFLAGYALARLQFRGRQFGILLLVLPLLPPVAILVPLVSYFQKLGLYNTYAAVIIANLIFNLPLSAWMIRNFILANPVEIEEAGRLDGCSRFGLMVRIVLPAVAPGLVAVAVFVFINSWNNYLYAVALTSSQSLRVLPQGILSFLGSWGTYWGGLTAAGMLALVPPVLLFFVFRNRFISGIFGQQSMT